MSVAPGRVGQDTTYSRVQQFYAAQLRLLDQRDLPGYAGTFTEDAEFTHTAGLPPSRTRAGILTDLMTYNKRFESDLQLRHWINMIDLKPAGDAELQSTAYCLVVKIRLQQEPAFVSCVMHDVLVEVDGEFLTRLRRIEYDGRV